MNVGLVLRANLIPDHTRVRRQGGRVEYTLRENVPLYGAAGVTVTRADPTLRFLVGTGGVNIITGDTELVVDLALPEAIDLLQGLRKKEAVK